VKPWIGARRTATSEAANQIGRRALDRTHAGRISMGAHIGFEKSSATFVDDGANGCFQGFSVSYILD
jgi:hypothetical protein